MTIAAIIVAAGRGTRAGGGIAKQWRKLRGKRVADHTLEVFDTHPSIDLIVLVLHPSELDTDLPSLSTPLALVAGGETRTASVRAGLYSAVGRADQVLIHDVARPLASHALIDRVLHALQSDDGAAPALPVTDALWFGEDGKVSGARNRDGLFRAQTPQAFHLAPLLDAFTAFDGPAADDVEVARAAGLSVAIVPGEEDNIKITRAEDFARAEDIMSRGKRVPMDIRIGNGFDVHRFGPGTHVMLCGVAVPFDRGLQGHSDADVGLHTITDAIFGALADGDIGQHFPPSDPKWKGAASHVFLNYALQRARERGFEISNIDCTLICEVPKIGPHAQAMRETVAKMTSLAVDRISIKATTTERLGFTGRGEGIAAMATVTLVGS